MSSKVMCWVACDRGSRLAALREAHEHAAPLARKADEIKADIIEHGCKDGVFTQHYETDALDASALLIPLVRFLPPEDERVRKTVMAIANHLTVDGLVLRYKVEETDDGLAGEEGTFTICSFWLVSALSEIGEHHLARDLCQKLLGYASPLHLYAEEIDPRSGRHLGNFPQAFTHLALINAVMHVIRADEKLAAGCSRCRRSRRRLLPEPRSERRRRVRRRREDGSADRLGDGALRRRRSARDFLRAPVLACSAPRLTALSISDTSLRCSVAICVVVACGHGGLEAPEVRLDLRRVVAVLEALALRAIVALDL